MKKIISIIIVCLFFIALIFIGKNLLKDGKEREYIKSDKYYEENIENININEVNFKFLQVNEVANVNEAFYKKYDSYKEVVVEEIFVRVCFEAVLSIGRLYGSGIVYLIV